MRKEFKSVNIKDDCFLYPLPVIKEQKYLLKVPPKFASFFIKALKNDFLLPPELDWGLWNEVGVHTDQKTLIFTFDREKLKFDFLPSSKGNEQKAETINQILNKKVKSVLNSEKDSFKDLMKTFENQKKCSTCQSLGILSPMLSELLEELGP